MARDLMFHILLVSSEEPVDRYSERGAVNILWLVVRQIPWPESVDSPVCGS